MAQAIERYFNVALYLLVLTGFGTLASTGGLDLPAVTIVGLALLVRGYQLAMRREFVIPHEWTNYLTLLYFFVYFGDYFLVSGSFLGATVHLVLFGMILRLFSLQRPRRGGLARSANRGVRTAGAAGRNRGLPSGRHAARFHTRLLGHVARPGRRVRARYCAASGNVRRFDAGYGHAAGWPGGGAARAQSPGMGNVHLRRFV